MKTEIKSAQDSLDEFFLRIPSIDGVDPKIVAKISQLYSDKKLTDSNLTNALHELQMEEINGKNKTN